MRIIILFALCRYAHSCAFISVIELPRIPAYCPKRWPLLIEKNFIVKPIGSDGLPCQCTAAHLASFYQPFRYLFQFLSRLHQLLRLFLTQCNRHMRLHPPIPTIAGILSVMSSMPYSPCIIADTGRIERSLRTIHSQIRFTDIAIP